MPKGASTYTIRLRGYKQKENNRYGLCVVNLCLTSRPLKSYLGLYPKDYCQVL